MDNYELSLLLKDGLGSYVSKVENDFIFGIIGFKIILVVLILSIVLALITVKEDGFSTNNTLLPLIVLVPLCIYFGVHIIGYHKDSMDTREIVVEVCDTSTVITNGYKEGKTVAYADTNKTIMCKEEDLDNYKKYFGKMEYDEVLEVGLRNTNGKWEVE